MAQNYLRKDGPCATIFFLQKDDRLLYQTWSSARR